MESEFTPKQAVSLDHLTTEYPLKPEMEKLNEGYTLCVEKESMID
jgi:hypothetical protein